MNKGHLVPDNNSPEVQPLSGRTRATGRQRNFALSAIALLSVVTIVATPVANTKLLAIPGYMTAFGSAMIVINILLAALLFSKGTLEANGDSTRLATAYLYVAIIFVPLVASFPGGIMPGSLIGTPISAVWLWSFWHAGFGLYIIRYAWLAKRPAPTTSLRAAMLGTFGAVALLTVVSTSLLPFLPSTLSDGHTLFSGASGLIPVVILVILLIALALVCRLGARNLEQISLTVAMVAALFDVWLTYQGSDRFSLGWYLSKCGSLVTSLVVLVTLLHEVTLLHRRAALANTELGLLARNLEKARDQAEEANKAKSSFLTGMTHELRTPLHGILGYAELLSLEGDLNLKQTERVTAMIGAGEHLLGLINAVLDVSQIEADRLDLHPIEIELSEFAPACLHVVRPAAEAKGLALALSIAGPVRVFADPTRLRQVLINLLGNAIKFTASGTIEIRLGVGEQGVRLEVADTGPGIPVEHHGKLFQAFERLDPEALSAVEGTGLGLAITARLVQFMGGRIGYAGNPGGGSVFWVELPACGAVPVESEAALTSPVAAKPGLRVLVVDDDALNRGIASGFLRIGGHDVLCLDNGVAAVEAAATGDFDVILMDVRMPGISGLEATRRIRALAGPRGLVPIVAVTAQAFAEQIEICRQAGMNTHVSKPFKQAALLAAVESIGAAAGVMPPARAADFPVFDRAQFDDTTRLLSAEDLEEYLRTLITRNEALLNRLRDPEMLAEARELAADAHALGGSAGAFGFQSLAVAARRFELAADTNAPETASLADELGAAINASLTIIQRELSPELNVSIVPSAAKSRVTGGSVSV
jgi:signal transduction histidine kinase/CheY-like chemotaxis protein/HPt (histidine-containing phosphotransfer) domain-containing protein